jgi:hypothetical protein
VLLALSALACGVLTGGGTGGAAPDEGTSRQALDRMLALLLQKGERFRDLPFRTVIQAATGNRVLPLDPDSAPDTAIIQVVSHSMDRVLNRLNRPDSPTNEESRINEVSSHFERALRETLDGREAFSCTIPKNAAGEEQRSGYPDLRLIHHRSGRVTYLDPKLVAQGSLDSSFRTFYYTPKSRTNKVLEDAHHLLIGIEHDANTGRWTFLRWHLVDLHGFKVRLKTEFQAGNDDLYRPDLLIRSSRRR